MPIAIHPHLGALARKQGDTPLDLYTPLEVLLGKAPRLNAHQLTSRGYPYGPRTLHRFHYIGPEGGDRYTRLGIFAGIHGDEVAGSLAAVRFIQELVLDHRLPIERKAEA